MEEEMSDRREGFMNLSLLTSVRQNHALEHATIAILSQKVPMGTRIMGRATSSGFYIYGDVPTEAVAEAAGEALSRLQKGEKELAVSPFCGTNLAVAGVMAGISSLIALGRENRIRRLPNAILAAIIAMMVAQPAGRFVQRYMTTSANLGNVSISRITQGGKGTRTVYIVETTRR